MSDLVIVAMITTSGVIVAASVPSYFAYKSAKISEKTHKAVNSRWDEFVEMAKKQFRSEGVAQERADEQSRKDKAQGVNPS